MLSLLLSVAIASWFALLYPIVRRVVTTNMPPQNARLALPLALVAIFAFMPLVFVVPRQDGTAILQEGLTASNIVTVFLTGMTGLYVGGKILSDRRALLVPFSMPYLPFTLMIAVNGLSALWSIVPSYTAYRTVELSIFTLASILIFDRADIERRLADLLAIVIVAWLAASLPVVVTNLAGGIVFSAGKHNMMPLVCAALGFLVTFDRRAPRRIPYFLLAVAGFAIAGSAASTASLAAVVPGMMIASASRPVRVLGVTAAALAGVLFVMLLSGLSSFSGLLDLLSVVLQKPVEELANATGRGTFWPTFIEATRDRVIGSGFSAADRFVQLLIPTSGLAEELGRETVFIASSHNMFLSAWAGTGVIGLGFAAVVLGTAFRWGMRLDLSGRRFVVSLMLFLCLNGMTTPGIFQDWNVHVLGFVAALAYARIALLNRSRIQSWRLELPAGAHRSPLEQVWRAS